MAKVLLKFLTKHEDLPIVAFFIGYDRDKVLSPAFRRLGLEEMDAQASRWRCAQALCKRTRNWKVLSLDDALSHFGYDRRDEDDPHDALEDARLAAQVYMAAMKLTPLKDGILGFVNEEED